jgi:hypothetical protein
MEQKMQEQIEGSLHEQELIENEIMDNKETKKEDWVNYRQLKKGEIIEKGDEVLIESGIGWVPTNSWGLRVPDPQYSAHRIFRRRISQ